MNVGKREPGASCDYVAPTTPRCTNPTKFVIRGPDPRETRVCGRHIGSVMNTLHYVPTLTVRTTGSEP